MDFWHFYIPVIAVCVLNIVYEICRKRTPDAPQRGLPAVFLCAVLLPAAAIYAGGYAVVWCADLFGGTAFPAVLAAVAGIVLLTVLLLHLLSNKLHIRRKNRIIAAVLLFLAYLAELTALGLSVLHNI